MAPKMGFPYKKIFLNKERNSFSKKRNFIAWEHHHGVLNINQYEYFSIEK